MNSSGGGTKLAPFTPSGDGVLAFALELLRLSGEDVLFDLGCGDGRMLVHAAEQTGSRRVHYNEELAERARSRVKEHGVQDLVTIEHGDALEADFSSATALFLYLVPQGIRLLLPRLEDARSRGVRIVTYVFSVPGWTSDEQRDFKGTKVFLYNPPASAVAGK